jgi:hypothetical protein
MRVVGVLVFFRVIPRRDGSNLYRLRSSRVPTPSGDGLELDGVKPVSGTYASSASKIFRHPGITLIFKATFAGFTPRDFTAPQSPAQL